MIIAVVILSTRRSKIDTDRHSTVSITIKPKEFAISAWRGLP